MDGPGDHHTKRSQSDRKSEEPYDFTQMWNYKTESNEETRQMKKQTNIYR